MQFLALFLLAVSAGALPQPPNPSPSVTLVNTTAPSMFKRKAGFEDPTIGNFDDPHCKGTHLGDKLIINVDADCVPFTPKNSHIDIFWGDANPYMYFFSDDVCSNANKIKEIDKSGGQKHKCVKVDSLNGTVKSMTIPGYGKPNR